MLNSLMVTCPNRTAEKARRIPAARTVPQPDNRLIAGFREREMKNWSNVPASAATRPPKWVIHQDFRPGFQAAIDYTPKRP